MGKLKDLGRAAIITWGLMLGGHGLEASAQNQDSIPENRKGKIELVSNKTNDALAIDLSKKQNLDSLYDISGKIENLLKGIDKEGNMNMYYGQDQYFEKLSDLVKEYETEIKKSGLCNYIFECGESEFDKRIDEIKQEIMSNHDKYGYLNSKGKFIINKENSENLIKDKFPEFYESISKDAFLEYRNKEYQINFKKYEQEIEYDEDEYNFGIYCILLAISFYLGMKMFSLCQETASKHG